MRLAISLQFCLSLLTLLVAGCSGSSAPPAAEKPSWVKYRSPEGDVHINFPVQPTEKESAMSGGRRKRIMLAPVPNQQLVYSLQYVEGPPPSDFQQALQKAQGGLVSAVHGTLQKEEEFQLGEWPGRALSFSFQLNGEPRVSTARLIAAGGRIYILTVTGNPELINPTDCERFFNSFALTSL